MALGATSVYATSALGNPWIVFAIVGVAGFVLLVPNVFSTIMVQPARLFGSVAWWQWLWFLLMMSGLVFRGRNATEINQSPVDGWALYRIGCVGLSQESCSSA